MSRISAKPIIALYVTSSRWGFALLFVTPSPDAHHNTAPPQRLFTAIAQLVEHRRK
jgi:hypothetical protein